MPTASSFSHNTPTPQSRNCFSDYYKNILYKYEFIEQKQSQEHNWEFTNS